MCIDLKAGLSKNLLGFLHCLLVGSARYEDPHALHCRFSIGGRILLFLFRSVRLKLSVRCLHVVLVSELLAPLVVRMVGIVERGKPALRAIRPHRTPASLPLANGV